jgi:peptidoglycan/LPS O-acetylase OafA/YrhL
MLTVSAKQWLATTCELRSSRNAEWIRIIAANLVLIHHMQPWATDLFSYKLLQVLSEFGAIYSVSCFWVYSGFVFDSVYNVPVSTTTEKRLSFLSFVLRRVRRLYPLHITMLCLILVYSWCRPTQSEFYVGTWHRLLANILLVQNFLGGTSELSINPVMWSVSIELVSYVVFFCWLRYSRKLLTAVIPFFVMIICVRLTGIYNSPIVSTGMFFAGVLISRCVKGINRNQHWVFALFISALIFGIGTVSNTLFSFRIVGLVAFGIILCMRLNPSKLIQFFADRTYTIYVTHYMFIPAAQFVIAKTNVSHYNVAILWWLLCWVTSILIDIFFTKSKNLSGTIRRRVSIAKSVLSPRSKPNTN